MNTGYTIVKGVPKVNVVVVDMAVPSVIDVITHELIVTAKDAVYAVMAG